MGKLSIMSKSIVLDELTLLADKYGADKSPNIGHAYTPFYYEYLKDKKYSIKKVLEIGIGNRRQIKYIPGAYIGASIRMWRDFFPNAIIYGADILHELLFRDERIETYLCDQRIKQDLENLIGQIGNDIDLFIDDGSHESEDQLFTCLNVMPMLKRDVIYIIEDVSYPDIVRQLDKYDCQLFGARAWRKGSWDDRLMVVRHR